MPSEQEAHVLERLARATPIRTRRMFGGVGIYSGDLFFALIADDVLYLKADDRNRRDFEARGMAAFQPFPDRPSVLSYYELPIELLDDARRLRPWVDKSLSAARAARERQVVRHPAQRRESASRPRGEKLLNLGPASMRWLADVGVRTRADLEKRGSVATWLLVRKKRHTSSANLLYALEGALLGLRHDRLPDVVKQNLRRRAGLD